MLFGRILKRFGVMRGKWRFGGVEDGKRGRRKSSGNRLFL